MQNEQEVIDRLGEPDAVFPAGKGMTSAAWICSKCKKMYEFDAPVRPPAPCACGSIFFEKHTKVLH